MHLYGSVNQDSKIDLYKRELFFTPIYHKIPEFYQKVLTPANEEKTLTRNDLDEILKQKTFQPIKFGRFFEDFSFVISSGSAVALFLIGFLATMILNDKFREKTDLCGWITDFINTETNETERVDIYKPCNYKLHWGGTFGDSTTLNPSNSPLTMGIASAVIQALVVFVVRLVNYYKTKEYNQSIDKAYDYKLERVKQLSCTVNLEDEVLDKDIGLIFPYLDTDALLKLKFSHLKKAKEVWEDLFQKKLNASLFSEQQLSIWRLFQRFLEANQQRQNKMLKDSLCVEIIGSEPLFFQEIIWKISPLKRNSQKTASICTILKEKILTKEVAFEFEEDDLIQTVIEVSEGKELKHVIKAHLKNNEKEILEDYLMLDDLEIAFNTFLEDGKLTITKLDCYYAFLSLATTKGDAAIINWLTAHIKKIWEEDDVFSGSSPDNLEMHYQLTERYGLINLTNKLKRFFVNNLKDSDSYSSEDELFEEA